VTTVVRDDFISARIKRGRARHGDPGDKEHFHIGAGETWPVLEGR